MKTIFAKLRSNRGSSMVMALILMLVAVMVSHTILAAAATAGRNVQLGDAGQQAYLTVSSAAETFRDAVLSFDGVFKKTITKEYATRNEYDADKPKSTVSAYTDLPSESPFSQEVEAALKHLTEYPASTYTHAYQIQAQDYDPVDMELTMQKKPNYEDRYILSAAFSNVIPGKALPENPCRITVTIEAKLGDVDRENGSDPNALKKWNAVTWNFAKPELTRIKEEANAQAEN